MLIIMAFIIKWIVDIILHPYYNYKVMKMVKGKKVLSLIVVLFSIILLSGCASVDYSRFIYPSGEINDRIVIEFSDEALSHCTVSKSKLYKSIINDLENYYIQPIEDFVYQFAMSGQHTLEEIALVKNGIKTNIELLGEKIVCDVTFANVAVFNLYYGVSSDESSDASDLEFREGAFVNKYVQSSQNAFAVLKTDYLKQFINKYAKLFNNYYALKDVKLTQVYASPNKGIYSNANETETVQGIKMHQWEISADNLDFNLEFYTLSPNTSTWYILALFISLIVTFVVWGLIHKQKMQQKNN